MQTITVTVNVSDPTAADAVAFLVPYNADRTITAPQKRQWCLNGSAGSDYLTTGQTTHKCAATVSLSAQHSTAHAVLPCNWTVPTHRCAVTASLPP